MKEGGREYHKMQVGLCPVIRVPVQFLSFTSKKIHKMPLLPCYNGVTRPRPRSTLGRGQERLDAPQSWRQHIFVSAQTPRGPMQRRSLLIPSNLDTVKHLEIGIWLISDRGTEGTLLRL
ncbi:hypothetical protein EYF80_029947 [Liparis tanakae]|uniref:Uncharacterized protein n=1 Tax=Liparis tanakae TaxID=230148 RepID=A0A4Z2H2N1_9TELE|nr:hypothetical protein EYF80_029947 [Liparis tanakae]